MAKVVKYVLQIDDKASPALNKGAKEADKYDDKLKDVGKSQEKVGVSAKAVSVGVTAVGAAALAAGKAVFELAQNVANLRNDLIDAETRSGIAAETLAGLRVAAEGSGQSFSALTSGLDKFGVQMANAARGGNVTAESFKKLGIDVVDANGAMRDGTEVFTETLSALNAMPPSAERSALAVDTLGRSGGKLLQALSGSGLDGFVELAREFGVGVGPKAAESAGQWQRNVAELNVVFEGLQARLADVISGPDGVSALTDALVIAGEFVSVFATEGKARFVDFGEAVVGIFKVIGDSIVRTGQAMMALAQGDFTRAALLIGDNMAGAVEAIADLGKAAASLAVGGFSTFNTAMSASEAKLASLNSIRLKTSTAQKSGGGTGATPTPDTAAGAAVVDVDAIFDRIAEGAKLAQEPTDGLAERLAALSQAYMDSGVALESATRAARAAAVGGKITDVAGIAGQVAGGNIGGALSSAGGMAGGAAGAALGPAAAVVDVLEDIGGAGVAQADADALARAQRKAERTGKDVSEFRTTGTDKEAAKATAEAISGQMEGFLDALLAGIQSLPDIMGKVLPKFITKLIGDFLPALLKNAGRMITAVTIDLPVALIKGLPKAIASLLKAVFVDLPKDFARAIGRLFTQLPRRIADAIRSALGLKDKGGGNATEKEKADARDASANVIKNAVQTVVDVFTPDRNSRNSRRSNQSRQAASIATAPAVRSRMDVARRPPVQSSRNAGPLRQGNPFSEFAKMQDSQGGPYGRDLSISTLTR